ncbi:MAG TPA: GNAT family N-acetyltransferase [Sutterella sp.]|nr:GNAT family N-acetyltransferase [Sutterella sp.]
MMRETSLLITDGFDDEESVRRLFRAYTEEFVQLMPEFAEYLALQGFEKELANLKSKYQKPEGDLLLAKIDGVAVGCVAMKRMNASDVEMKRLYVEPAYRRLGIGRQLVEAIIESAKRAGYRRMFLDTQPVLKAAVALYEKSGFTFTSRYNDSPIAQTLFMVKDLGL